MRKTQNNETTKEIVSKMTSIIKGNSEEQNEEQYFSLNIKGQTVEEEAGEIEKNLLSVIAKFFRAKRDKIGISQRELNKRSHVGLGVIADLEKENSMPRIESLIKIGIGLELRPTEVATLLNSIVPQKSSLAKSRNDNLLTEIIGKCGYDKEEIVEIANYLTFIDYKKQQKRKQKKIQENK